MRRYFYVSASERDLLDSPAAVVSYCRASLEAENNEVFEVLFLNSKNRLLSTERIAEGTINRAAVYPRRVVESALKARAAALILVHNHPSGDPEPSLEDRELTQTIIDAARTVGIKIHDHIIVGKGRHYSFAQQGALAEKAVRARA